MMTDNRTTELLCKLLEERGIEWKDGDAAYEIEWNTPDGRHCSAMYWMPTFSVLISGCTPEQAIAATLGSDEPPYDVLLRCLEHDWNISASWDGLRKFWCIELTEEGVRIRDDATCEMELTELSSGSAYHDVWLCGACGAQVEQHTVMGKSEPPNYCPNCGRRVER